MALYTLQKARDELERFYRSKLPELSDSYFIDWSNDLNNYLYTKLCSVDDNRFSNVVTYAVSSSFSLPVDFDNILYYNTGIYLLDSNGNRIKKLFPTQKGSVNMGYYMDSTDVYITGIQNNSVNVELQYIPVLTQLSSMSDNFLIDEFYKNVIDSYMRVAYESWDMNDYREVFEDQKFARNLSLLLSRYKRTPNVYNLSNAYSSKIQ